MEAQGMGLYPACWHCGSVNKRSLLNMRRPMTWVELPAKTCLLAVFDEVVKTGWMGKQLGATGCKLLAKQLAVFLTKRKPSEMNRSRDYSSGCEFGRELW